MLDEKEFELRSRYWSFDRFPSWGGTTPEKKEKERLR
jgi:hypothetical protein